MELLANALEYMEANLSEEIKTEDVAKACYCSKAALEKLFRCLNHISIHDYVVRRRMTLAARELADNQ
jgi:AraC family transcriptional regulator